MSHHIEKDNPKRWFLIQDSGTSEPSIILFGSAGDQWVNVLVTGQPNLLDYLTEGELETEVNTVTGIPDYYKDSVETESDKFQGPSGIY